jgi:Hydrogenase/urease nickel incorporation, metallochaperone, hypA
MHEMGLVKALIQEVERIARSYGAPKVLSVRVRMGALCPFSEGRLLEHFLREAKGTVAERAKLVIERGTDPADPLDFASLRLDAHALDVTLLSIEVEDLLPMTLRATNVDISRQT